MIDIERINGQHFLSIIDPGEGWWWKGVEVDRQSTWRGSKFNIFQSA